MGVGWGRYTFLNLDVPWGGLACLPDIPAIAALDMCSPRPLALPRARFHTLGVCSFVGLLFPLSGSSLKLILVLYQSSTGYGECRAKVILFPGDRPVGI